jgi:hypothetical protein
MTAVLGAWGQRVVRADERSINVVQQRAHLSYCYSGCCDGRASQPAPPVPARASYRLSELDDTSVLPVIRGLP